VIALKSGGIEPTAIQRAPKSRLRPALGVKISLTGRQILQLLALLTHCTMPAKCVSACPPMRKPPRHSNVMSQCAPSSARHVGRCSGHGPGGLLAVSHEHGTSLLTQQSRSFSPVARCLPCYCGSIEGTKGQRRDQGWCGVRKVHAIRARASVHLREIRIAVPWGTACGSCGALGADQGGGDRCGFVPPRTANVA
jgi:hypothetical protein